MEPRRARATRIIGLPTTHARGYSDHPWSAVELKPPRTKTAPSPATDLRSAAKCPRPTAAIPGQAEALCPCNDPSSHAHTRSTVWTGANDEQQARSDRTHQCGLPAEQQLPAAASRPATCQVGGWARAGSRRTRLFRARGSAVRPGSGGWPSPPPRRPETRTPARSLRRVSSILRPPSPGL